MKKLLILLCVLALLLSLPGVASASKPVQGTFTISGYTDPYSVSFEQLPSGLFKFELSAVGAVAGDYFDGAGFTFDESGIVKIGPTGTGSGNNKGTMTIIASDGSQAVIHFGGRSEITGYDDYGFPEGSVEGSFTVLHGTGQYANLHGQGKYSGGLGLVFTVTFTGKFHNDP